MGGGTKTPPKTKPAKPPDKVTEEDTDVMEVTETPATETGSNESTQNGEGNIEETPANTGNWDNQSTPDEEDNNQVATYAAVTSAQEPTKVHVDHLRIVLKKTEPGASFHLKDKEKANLVFTKLGVLRGLQDHLGHHQLP